VRPKLPPAPPEMPAKLRCFSAAAWSDAGDDPAQADYLARRRFTDAWVGWCRNHSVDPVVVLRRRRNDRRVADGLEPVNYTE